MPSATATDYLIPGIMQHIERAGIHSGDSISVYPAQTLSQKVRATIIDYTEPSGPCAECGGPGEHPVRCIQR